MTVCNVDGKSWFFFARFQVEKEVLENGAVFQLSTILFSNMRFNAKSIEKKFQSEVRLSKGNALSVGVLYNCLKYKLSIVCLLLGIIFLP